ncbi:PspC domain-containing protein [Actinomadura atramentaria]|uniref:PspC domain-containing protein n=1 Tax=Actinomadura atramentaria TaxID=1990 RepID=UPI0003A6A05B|nr:PspC domain-containing protein [Actinomadura atramentaria]
MNAPAGGTAEADPQPAPREGRLTRVPEGRILAGVCTGLSARTGIDAVVYRVAFGLLVVAQGQGIPLYIAAYLLMAPSPAEASHAERIFKRRFDATTVLALLGAFWCAVVVAGLAGSGFSANAVTTLTIFGLALLVAHSRGVDFAALARSMPERLHGQPPEPATGSPVSLDKQPTTTRVPDGMIDLAEYSSRNGYPTEPEAPEAPPAPAKPPKPKKARKAWSPLSVVTLWIAFAVCAAVYPFADGLPDERTVLVVGGAALAVVSVGLLAGGWIRTRGLVLAGALLTLALLTDTVVMKSPHGIRIGDVDWRPATVASTQQGYHLTVGTGRLDLTRLAVGNGERVRIKADVVMGALKLTVPRGARVNLTARLLVGDLTVDRHTLNGPKIDHTQVLEPESPVADPPVIDLNVRTGLGDVEVRRG